MKKLLTGAALVACALLSPFAHSEAEFLDVITAKYKIPEGSPLANASCGICHVSDSDFHFNPYGKQVSEKLTQANSKTVTDAILTSVEGLDADGDGIPNGDELRAGTFPGKPDAKAGGMATTAPATTAPATEGTAEQKPPAFPPKNGFHPAIVHFPIALLIAGLLLDLGGLLWKQKTLLFAGWYNLVLASVCAFAAVASGFLAVALRKVPYKGLIMQHMLLALAVTGIMWVMVAIRIHRHEQMNIPARVFYYVLAFAALVMISWAGHLGGVFVYGE